MGFVSGIVCDACKAQIAFKYIGKKHMTEYGRTQGWSFLRKEGKDICYCPKCKGI